MKISVLMSAYAGEKPANLDECLWSLRRQTLKPSEILLVEDGPLTPELQKVIARHRRSKNPILRSLPLPQCQGNGPAMRAGLPLCRNEWVARMDTDDICLPYRLKTQAEYLSLHPDISLLGGISAEFEGDPEKSARIRNVPLSPAQIRLSVKFRNPMNHMTVMFRKSHVLASGSYGDHPNFEDYDLWCRMMAKGYRAANLPQTLVFARFNQASLDRRRGLGYIRQEFRHLWNMRALGLINWVEWGFLFPAKALARLMPLGILKVIYGNFLRKKTIPQTGV